MFKKGDLVRYYRQTIGHNPPYNKTGRIYRVVKERHPGRYILSHCRKETRDFFSSNELQLLKKG